MAKGKVWVVRNGGRRAGTNDLYWIHRGPKPRKLKSGLWRRMGQPLQWFMPVTFEPIFQFTLLKGGGPVEIKFKETT